MSTHVVCSSLTKFLSTKRVQTRFVAPPNPSIDICLVIKAIISYDNFIAIDQIKRSGARLFFSEFNFTDKKFRRRQAKCVNGNVV